MSNFKASLPDSFVAPVEANFARQNPPPKRPWYKRLEGLIVIGVILYGIYKYHVEIATKLILILEMCCLPIQDQPPRPDFVPSQERWPYSQVPGPQIRIGGGRGSHLHADTSTIEGRVPVYSNDLFSCEGYEAHQHRPVDWLTEGEDYVRMGESHVIGSGDLEPDPCYGNPGCRWYCFPVGTEFQRVRYRRYGGSRVGWVVTEQVMAPTQVR